MNNEHEPDTTIDNLIEPSPTTTTGGNEDFGDLIEKNIEQEVDAPKLNPNERFTKSPHNKVKAKRRASNKSAKKSRKLNRKK